MNATDFLREDSLALRAVRTVRTRLREAYPKSRTRAVCQTAQRLLTRGEDRTSASLSRATRGSRLQAAGETVGGYVRTSRSYRWLTAEPEPDVVVVDLRETVTLGWLITLGGRLHDRLGPALVAAVDRSGLAAVGRYTRVRFLRVAGVVLTGVTLASLATHVGSGMLGRPHLVAHAFLLVVGVTALRSQASWSDVRESTVGRWLATAVAPPVAPEDESPRESDADTATRNGRPVDHDEGRD